MVEYLKLERYWNPWQAKVPSIHPTPKVTGIATKKGHRACHKKRSQGLPGKGSQDFPKKSQDMKKKKKENWHYERFPDHFNFFSSISLKHLQYL